MDDRRESYETRSGRTQALKDHRAGLAERDLYLPTTAQYRGYTSEFKAIREGKDNER